MVEREKGVGQSAGDRQRRDHSADHRPAPLRGERCHDQQQRRDRHLGGQRDDEEEVGRQGIGCRCCFRPRPRRVQASRPEEESGVSTLREGASPSHHPCGRRRACRPHGVRLVEIRAPRPSRWSGTTPAARRSPEPGRPGLGRRSGSDGVSEGSTSYDARQGRRLQGDIWCSRTVRSKIRAQPSAAHCACYRSRRATFWLG